MSHQKILNYIANGGKDVFKNYDIKIDNANANDLFYNAIFYQNIEVMKEFIEHGIDIHYDNEWYLKEAVRDWSHKAIKFLIDNGADARVITSNHLTCDKNCSTRETIIHIEIIKYLVKKGADIDIGKCLMDE